jgi:hypothetical protein
LGSSNTVGKVNRLRDLIMTKRGRSSNTRAVLVEYVHHLRACQLNVWVPRIFGLAGSADR